MVRAAMRLAIAATLALAPGAIAQTNPATVGKSAPQGGQGASGQQMGQPIPNQNQPQRQTSASQQPPNVKTLPPTASAQNQPNPKPELAK